jgi:ABC-type ATPase with predicted acetyltransferase domain
MHSLDLVSEKAATAAAMFGLDPATLTADRAPRALRRAAALVALRIHLSLAPGHVALITGPSGAGKSMILKALAARVQCRVPSAECPDATQDSGSRTQDFPLVDLFPLPLPETLSLLARLGLAEATLFTRYPSELSDGQRARLELALAIARSSLRASVPGGACLRAFPPTILADEFLSTLDRTTARNVARSLRRCLASESSVRLVAATAHDDLIEALEPDRLVRVPLGFGSGAEARFIPRASTGNGALSASEGVAGVTQ